MNYFDIGGKVIAVTGGGGVLLSEACKAFAKQGAKVACMSLHKENADKVVEEILADGGDAIALKCNVLDKESLVAAKNAILAKYGTIDVLINGAGGNKKEATESDEMSFFDIPTEALQFVFDLNLMGTVSAIQVFGEIFKEKGEGNIINVSSMASFAPLTKVVGYSAAKAALNNFTQWMAVYVNQKISEKIRVNAVAPGFFLTRQNEFLLKDKETGKNSARGQLILDNTPMGRYGTPEELVSSFIFLMSDSASFINGIILPIDGGFSAFSGV